MLKTGAAVAVAVLLVPSSAYAQQMIDAGTQLQQIPPAPTPQNPIPEIRVEKPASQPDDGPAGASVRVASINVTGETIFPEAELVAVSGFVPGGDFNLQQLRQFASKIAAFYNARGYFLAQAYLPAQDIRNGAVTIAVIEGRYGQINLRNRTNLRDGVARGVIRGLDSGDIVSAEPLERRLLLLSDIPGVEVKSTLSPGTAVGTSDLAVDIDPAHRINGSLEADNGGNHFTGALRFGGSLNLNNPTGHGDLLSLRALASTSGLAFGRVAYQTLVGTSTIGVAYSHIRYNIGREFKSLDADGTADVLSLYGSQPLVRSRRANLYALAGLDAKWFADRLGAAGTETRRRAKVLSVGLSGNHLDGWGGGGSNTYSIGATLGDLDIRSAADLAVDRVTARSNGGYGKLQASFARVQNVTGPLSFYSGIRVQLASKNLDSSEKMELGGAYAVRAYPEGEAYGDEGYVGTVEARLQLPTIALPGRIQLIGFVDVGKVRFAKNPWFTGSNVAHRSGVGVGVNWIAPNNFLVQATYAQKLGDQRSTSFDDGRGRFWFHVAKFF